MKRLTLSLLFIAGILGTGISQSGGIYTLTNITVASGVTRMSGGVFAASVTTGQPASGVRATGGTFSVIPQAPPIFPVLPPFTNVPICGRVVTADGRGLNKAIVALNDQMGTSRSVLTAPHGEFCFADVPTGRVYSITASAKHYMFQPFVISLSDRVDGLDLIGNRDGGD